MTTLNIKQNYSVRFSNSAGEIGALDFNGPAMTFTGNADESAQLFFELIASSFEQRLKEEREAEREACAKTVETFGTWDMTDRFAAAIRARGQA